MRALFEACMAQNRKRFRVKIGDDFEKEKALTEQQIQDQIDEYLHAEDVQWANFKPDPQKHESTRPPKEDDVPLVSVCVEGGDGTISTVLEAVKNGALGIVRGAGGFLLWHSLP